MPNRSTAAREHAITQDLSSLPAQPTRESLASLPAANFPLTLRGYDRESVDAYVNRASQLLAELQARRTPEGAVNRALERVGEEVASILRRAHETAEQITTQSRRDADDRLRQAEREAVEITTSAKTQLQDLDADTDRIWTERNRIIEDARELAVELVQLAATAAERFPPIEEEAIEEEEGAVEEEDDGAALEGEGVVPEEEGATLREEGAVLEEEDGAALEEEEVAPEDENGQGLGEEEQEAETNAQASNGDGGTSPPRR